jgi:hypothetical protein
VLPARRFRRSIGDSPARVVRRTLTGRDRQDNGRRRNDMIGTILGAVFQLLGDILGFVWAILGAIF